MTNEKGLEACRKVRRGQDSSAPVGGGYLNEIDAAEIACESDGYIVRHEWDPQDGDGPRVTWRVYHD